MFSICCSVVTFFEFGSSAHVTRLRNVSFRQPAETERSLWVMLLDVLFQFVLPHTVKERPREVSSLFRRALPKKLRVIQLIAAENKYSRRVGAVLAAERLRLHVELLVSVQVLPAGETLPAHHAHVGLPALQKTVTFTKQPICRVGRIGGGGWVSQGLMA